ncbi:hypothetical protein J7L67_03330 [bacterium]|nr:hypothetical protein [bacterium]
MKKFGFLFILIFCCAASVVAIDYDNDGYNDTFENGAQDDYRPYFIRHDMKTINIYIDFDQTVPLFSMTLNNAVMYPLEQGTVDVQIEFSQIVQINGAISQDIASGALQLQIAEIPGNTVIQAGTPVTITDNSVVSLPFTIAYLTPDMANLPLTLNLYNTSSGNNMHLVSSDINVFQQTDDRPAGKVLSVNSSMVIGDTEIIQGDTLQVQGWAFDDNEGMAVSLNFKRDESDNNTAAVVNIAKSVDPVNNTIPYWGASYPSGFLIDWAEPDRRGNYLITPHLNDGSHDVALETKKIFWNKKPEIQLDSPQPYTNIYTMNYLIAGEAVDLDVNLGIGAYLSSVEVYIDDNSNLIKLITNNILSNENMNIQFDWTTVSDYAEGEHTILAVAHDSFGLQSDELQIPIVIYKTVPLIINVSPRLGPWEGNNIVSITGNGLAALSNVSFENIPAAILPGATDSLVQVVVNSFVPSESRYTEVRLSNDYGSYFKQDAYRFIPAELNALNTDSQIADIKYSNLEKSLYILNIDEHAVDVYEQDNGNGLQLNYTASFNTQGTDAKPEYKMELSRLEDIMFVIYEDSNRIDIYDLQNDGAPLDVIYLLDNEGTAVSNNSFAYLMGDEFLMSGMLLVGTQGENSGLYLVYLDIADYNHSIEEITLPGSYDSVNVYSCANKSTAYIIYKSSATGEFTTYRYDAKYDLFSGPLPTSMTLAPGEIDELKLSTNYNGIKFLLYTTSQISQFDKYGLLLGSASYGMDLAVYDSCRSVFYSLNGGDISFHIRSLDNLTEEITYCDLPENSHFALCASLDWNGDFMFALSAEGTAVVKVGDIYPQIQDLPTFVQSGQTVHFKVNNIGQVPENVVSYVDDTEKASNFDNDTSTYALTSPLDNDTAEKLYIKLYGYPSKQEPLYMMSKLADVVDNNIGLQFFYPTGLFYDELRSDLYAFDPSQTGGFSILRFHIEVDNNGEVAVTRKMVPFQMQIGNPLSMTFVHDYIVVLSLYSHQCTWFNVTDFDANGTAQVHTAAISPFITPSGIAGYSPADNPDMNYVYIWNSLSTGGLDVFQLDIDTGITAWCGQILSPHTTNIYIDHNPNDYTKDRAYAVSSSLSGAQNDIITVFEPFKSAFSISPLASINLGSSGGAYKIAANDAHFFVSLYDSKGITLFDPDLSGNSNHFIYNILNNDSKYSRFLTVDENNLVFSGKESDNLFTLSFMDLNPWNDYPYVSPFDINENYTVSSSQLQDVKIIKGKVFTVIGHEIYIINLINKEEE